MSELTIDLALSRAIDVLRGNTSHSVGSEAPSWMENEFLDEDAAEVLKAYLIVREKRQPRKRAATSDETPSTFKRVAK